MKSFFKNNEIKSIKTRLSALRIKIMELDEPRQILRQEIEERFEEPIEESITKITKEEKQQLQIDKKDIVKDKILKIIQTKNLTGGEVKQKVVDEAKACSKASYYRYIQELKREGKIESVSINNQEFLYSRI